MNTQSDTPETDKAFAAWTALGQLETSTPWSLARKLERERDELRELARRAMVMLDIPIDAPLNDWPEVTEIDKLVAKIAAILPQTPSAPASAG